MIPKVKLVFDRKNKCGKSGEGDVEVYVYHNGRKRYLATGVHVKKREYRDGVISVRPDAVELNKRLQTCIRMVQEQVNEMVEADNIALGDLCIDVTERNDNLWEWGVEFISKKKIADVTKKNKIGMLKSMQRVSGIEIFADATKAAIERIDEGLSHLKDSSRLEYHNALKGVLTQARKAGKISTNPYDDIDLHSKGRDTKIKYLTLEDLNSLEELNGTIHRLLQRSLDIFLFGCYTGLRYSDITRLSKSNFVVKNGVKWLVGEQRKTGNDFAIVLSDKMVRILDKYDWKLYEHLSQLNRRLKTISALAGLGRNLTMHMSRHTFATRALSKGVRMEVVSKMLGHTDITMTQIYAKVLNEDVAKGFELLED